MVVLFYDEDTEKSKELHEVLKAMELVDDSLDNSTVFVKFCDKDFANEAFGLKQLPAIAYFDQQIPGNFILHKTIFCPDVLKYGWHFL